MAVDSRFVSIGGVVCRIAAGNASAFANFSPFEITDGLAHDERVLEIVSDMPALVEKRERVERHLTERGRAVYGALTEAPKEEDALYGVFGEKLPLYHRVIFHGVAVSYEGKGYVFTAASGTGKSTHAFLWRRYLGDAVHILSGDKPVISVDGDDFEGEIRVWGTPWGGKEQIFENGDAPLCGLGLICRDTRNYVERCDAAEFFDVPFQQMFIPGGDPAASLALKVGEALLERVPLYRIHCDMSEDAVRASFEGLTGLEYDAHRAR